MLDDLVIPEFEEILNHDCAQEVYLTTLFDYYHQCLMSNFSIHNHVLTTGLSQGDITERKIGYCDRTLAHFIKNAFELNGDSFRCYLRAVKLIKISGHELFRGCVVEPFFDENNHLVSVCGIKANKRVNRSSPRTLYWYRHNVYRQSPSFALKDTRGCYVN